jgi:hypothetical protein
MFASNTFSEHIFRGAAGVASIAAAIFLGRTGNPAALFGSLLLGALALVAFRGCPMCWTSGLLAMIGMRFVKSKGMPAEPGA